MSTGHLIAEATDEGTVVEQELQESQEQELSREEIPEKWRNADKATLAKAYSELEKKLGQQGQELGELRKSADQYIKQTLENQRLMSQQSHQATQSPVEEVDWESNPQEAAKVLIRKELEPIVNQLQGVNYVTFHNQMDQQHPQWRETVQNTDFQKWISSSPTRSEQFMKADQADYDAAHDLFQTWEERQTLLEKANKSVAEEVKSDRNKKLEDAHTETGSSSAEGNRGKKIFRRADLIRMQNEDKQRYMTMQDEIMQAYREGRVR